MTNYKTTTYRAQIGSLNTKLFGTLQKYLEQVDVPERMSMLYRQLEKEIELEKGRVDIEDCTDGLTPRDSL